MKKFYSLVMLALMSLLGFTAGATTFTLIVDNADLTDIGCYKKTFGMDFPSPFQYVSGTNTINTTGTVMYVKPGAADAVIDAVTVNDEPAADFEHIDIVEGMVVNVTSHAVTGDAHFTINCDDYSRVALNVGSTPVELTSNSQEVPFTIGTTIAISAADPAQPIISVTHNGNPVSQGFSTAYTISNASDGDVIEVKTIANYYCPLNKKIHLPTC